MLVFIIVLVVVGFVVGLIARALVPGRDNMGCIFTTLVGIAGSFVGGFLQQLIEHHHLEVHKFHTVGIIGSILGAIVLVILLRITHLEPRRR